MVREKNSGNVEEKQGAMTLRRVSRADGVYLMVSSKLMDSITKALRRVYKDYAFAGLRILFCLLLS